METAVATLFSPSSYLTEAAVQRQLELLKRTYSNSNMKASEAASSSRLLALAPMRHSSDSKLRAILGNKIFVLILISIRNYSLYTVFHVNSLSLPTT